MVQCAAAKSSKFAHPHPHLPVSSSWTTVRPRGCHACAARCSSFSRLVALHDSPVQHPSLFQSRRGQSSRRKSHAKLKKTQKSLSPFGWDTEPVMGTEVIIKEAFMGVFCDLVYGGGWMDTELSTTPPKLIKKPLRVPYPRVYVVQGLVLAGAGTSQSPSIRRSPAQITKRNRTDEHQHTGETRRSYYVGSRSMTRCRTVWMP